MALPNEALFLVSLRRSIPVQLSKGNGDKYVSIMTSEGTQEVGLNEYLKFVEKMQPDLVLAVPDLPTFSLQQRQDHYVEKHQKKAEKIPANYTPEKDSTVESGKTKDSEDYNPRVRTKPFIRTATPKTGENLATGLVPRPGGNRIKKMVSRTEQWMKDLVGYYQNGPENSKTPSFFAPMLPYVDLRTQNPYLEYVEKLHKSGANIAGLTFWSYFGNELERVKDEGKEQAIPEGNLWENVDKMLREKGLHELVRYSNAPMETPHDVLDMILKSGSDLFNGDLVTQYTDSGVVLDFRFPVESNHETDILKKPIGMNMWDSKFTTDMSALGEETPNVTGTHNRAYIHHLLDAHEMTAWVILQMHNLHVLKLFFEGIQNVLEKESQSGNEGLFEQEVAKFRTKYGDRTAALLVKEYEGQKGIANVGKGRFDDSDIEPGSKGGEGSPLGQEKDESSLKKERHPKARSYALRTDELTERTRGLNVGQKLNETRWSKDLEAGKE